ncbi:MAG: hypothetical protein RSE06_06350 [Comamonas sp.]
MSPHPQLQRMPRSRHRLNLTSELADMLERSITAGVRNLDI